MNRVCLSLLTLLVLSGCTVQTDVDGEVEDPKSADSEHYSQWWKTIVLEHGGSRFSAYRDDWTEFAGSNVDNGHSNLGPFMSKDHRVGSLVMPAWGAWGMGPDGGRVALVPANFLVEAGLVSAVRYEPDGFPDVPIQGPTLKVFHRDEDTVVEGYYGVAVRLEERNSGAFVRVNGGALKASDTDAFAGLINNRVRLSTAVLDDFEDVLPPLAFEMVWVPRPIRDDYREYIMITRNPRLNRGE